MKPDRPYALLFSCEHATNHIPGAYRSLFRNADSVLKSHRGWDPGTAPVAEILATRFQAPLFQSKASRLLVECNRSLEHPDLWSEFTRPLSQSLKNQILEQYYFPYRNQIVEEIQAFHRHGLGVLHVSVHSFTPCLNGVERQAEIGLLYDPSRKRETEICRRWKRRLNRLVPGWRVRRNYPYRGKADGLTTFLRKQFEQNFYLGIELEISQAMLQGRGKRVRDVAVLLAESLACLANPTGQYRF